MNELIQIFKLDKNNMIIEYRDSTGIYYKNPQVHVYKGLCHLQTEEDDNKNKHKKQHRPRVH
jgi:hypothetical protein